jgi:ribonuclease D
LPENGSAVEVVTTGPRLAAVVESALRQPRVAVDLESNGFFRYPERVCLVQLATQDAVHIIDPLSVDDPAPLGRLLADPSVGKIFHSADYDIRSLDRDWGFHVRGLFDTSIAAAFVGSEKLGLAAVLKEYLDVEVSKEKRLQRADWSKRPLTDEMLRYAAQDVLHLGRFKATLDARLAKLGRTAWVREEIDRLARVRHNPPDVEWGFLSVKGSRTLDERGLAVLRSLHSFRENEALMLDRPPFKVFSDSVIVELAADPHCDIARVKGIGRYGRGPAAAGVRRAIREGLSALPVRRPRTPRSGSDRLSPKERTKVRERLRLLKGWRAEQASKLRLDPPLVWPAVSLERLASRPDSLPVELDCEDVRHWQKREFGDSLRIFTAREVDRDPQSTGRSGRDGDVRDSAAVTAER